MHLPPDTIIWRLQSAGVRVIIDDAMPTCCVHLGSDMYTMRLGKLYATADDEGKRTLLLHETAHIMRGDCLVKDKDPQQWNIAADSQINGALDVASVRALRGVTYEDIRAAYPTLPEWLPGAAVVYDALAKGQEASPLTPKSTMDDAPSMESDADEKVVRATHAQTVLAVREELREELDAIGNMPIGRSTGTSKLQVKLVPAPQITRLLAAVRGLRSGARVMARTFARPGRIEGLRGQARIPRLRVMVAVDCSGSVSNVQTLLHGVARWLARAEEVDIYTFDTGIMRWRVGDPVPDGGGTSFAQVFATADNGQYDALVMVTDGDAPEAALPRCPVVWAITAGGHVPALRANDRMVALG